MGRVRKPLTPILVVWGISLVVLELPPPSSSFTEASEVWVRVAWMPSDQPTNRLTDRPTEYTP